MIETRELPVRLTAVELADRSDRLAKALRQKQDLETEAALIAKRFKGQIAELTAEVDKLARTVAEKQEMRDIVINRHNNRMDRVQIVYRDDTGEEIERRPLTGIELNEDLPFEQPSAVREDFSAEVEPGIVETTVGEMLAGEPEIPEDPFGETLGEATDEDVPVEEDFPFPDEPAPKRRKGVAE